MSDDRREERLAGRVGDAVEAAMGRQLPRLADVIARLAQGVRAPHGGAPGRRPHEFSENLDRQVAERWDRVRRREADEPPAGVPGGPDVRLGRPRDVYGATQGLLAAASPWAPDLGQLSSLMGQLRNLSKAFAHWQETLRQAKDAKGAGEIQARALAADPAEYKGLSPKGAPIRFARSEGGVGPGREKPFGPPPGHPAASRTGLPPYAAPTPPAAKPAPTGGPAGAGLATPGVPHTSPQRPPTLPKLDQAGRATGAPRTAGLPPGRQSTPPRLADLVGLVGGEPAPGPPPPSTSPLPSPPTPPSALPAGASAGLGGGDTVAVQLLRDILRELRAQRSASEKLGQRGEDELAENLAGPQAGEAGRSMWAGSESHGTPERSHGAAQSPVNATGPSKSPSANEMIDLVKTFKDIGSLLK